MTYRVYYNREEDYPQRWSFDEGSVVSEVNVQDVQIHGCDCRTSGESSLVVEQWTREQRARFPIAWLRVTARRVVIRNGTAHFYPTQ